MITFRLSYTRPPGRLNIMRFAAMLTNRLPAFVNERPLRTPMSTPHHSVSASFRATTRETIALPSWRLSRAVEYVDAHLSESIGLEDIARSTGLTRMHFASQFRRATGLRPHEYLLRRRIERAQRLLLESRHNVLDVALSCGFQTQAHFTTVFKRFVGETPYCWRIKTNVNRSSD